MQPVGETFVLPYATARRRKRALPLTLALAALALATALLWHPVEEWWRDYRLRHETFRLQQRYLRYAAPRGRVIYTDVRNEAAVLLNRPDYARVWSHLPEPSLPPLAAGYAEPGIGEMLLFMHGRTSSADGKERIVIVQLQTEAGGAGLSTMSLAASVTRPLKGPGVVTRSGRTSTFPLPWLSRRNTRFLAGQPDPLDATHFTIDYEHDGRAGVIDGWLLADEGVNFKLPATRPTRSRGSEHRSVPVEGAVLRE